MLSSQPERYVRVTPRCNELLHSEAIRLLRRHRGEVGEPNLFLGDDARSFNRTQCIGGDLGWTFFHGRSLLRGLRLCEAQTRLSGAGRTYQIPKAAHVFSRSCMACNARPLTSTGKKPSAILNSIFSLMERSCFLVSVIR